MLSSGLKSLNFVAFKGVIVSWVCVWGWILSSGIVIHSDYVYMWISTKRYWSHIILFIKVQKGTVSVHIKKVIYSLI
jgi:hypothetical protein